MALTKISIPTQSLNLLNTDVSNSISLQKFASCLHSAFAELN